MKIGEFARRAGVSASKVRFYEAQGLLPAPTRSANGYRDFGAADLERLIKVRRALVLGFSVDQLARFVALPAHERHDKTPVIEAAVNKLAELDLHLAEVHAQRREIAAFVEELKAEQAARGITAKAS